MLFAAAYFSSIILTIVLYIYCTYVAIDVFVMILYKKRNHSVAIHYKHKFFISNYRSCISSVSHIFHCIHINDDSIPYLVALSKQLLQNLSPVSLVSTGSFITNSQ